MIRPSLPARLVVGLLIASALSGCAPAALRARTGAAVSVITGFDVVPVRAGSFRRPGPRVLVSRSPEGTFTYPLLVPARGPAVLLQGEGGRYALPELSGYTQIFTVVSRSPLPLTPEAVVAAGSVDAVGKLVGSVTRNLPAGTWNVTTDVFRVSDFGSLVVESFPPDSDVSVDGRSAGRTPLRLDAVEAGSVRVNVSHSGYAPAARTVQIGPDQTSRLEVRLTPLPVTTGLLKVASSLPATVTVDGLKYGVAPVTLRLGAGEHTVVVESGSGTEKLNLQIRARAQVNVACQGTDADLRCIF